MFADDKNKINDNKKHTIIAQGSHLNDDKHNHQNELSKHPDTLCQK